MMQIQTKNTSYIPKVSTSNEHSVTRQLWRSEARFAKYLTIYHKTDYLKFVVRSTHDGDLRRDKISLGNIVS